ncbi:hypothetical protein D3Y59_05670 [Hymenobacter oligotrophus]|uniref:Glycosyltransferase RgtA/B/C/D-like domain-containing protein n=1 Tax=Hymenobacter oligotrophus TaxID=2319843 RepID=A0A3B7R5V7_9BACT|nr:hypothetical protein [Hymenobacter oligotrophus]AYA36589.1 hypothetical protein D3Y59_05670 [Hymenobacter oligotrophus]
MNHEARASWLRIWGLPLGLLLLVALGPGCYYETNDDFVITLLLRGRTAAAPVANLHLYFHGWAWLLAALYQHWPAVPWYGLLLYALLYLSLVLLTAVLEALLRPHLGGRARTATLAGFLLLAGLEHAMWFNYVRVPLLLAGGAVLFAAQRVGGSRRSGGVLLLGAALFALAWAIRPSAAVLGLVVVAPAAAGLAGWRRGWLAVALAAGVALAGGGVLHLGRSPEAARYRQLDVLKSNVNDYQLYAPRPRTAPDSLGVRAVEQWVLGDSTLVNEALFARAFQLDPNFLRRTAPAKLQAAATQLLRNYFPLLLLHAWLAWVALAAWPLQKRRGWWVYVLGAGLLLIGLGVVLKLPPRLAGPLLTLLAVGHAAVVLQAPLPWPPRRHLGRRLGLGIALLVAGLYGYKVLHRSRVLAAEQARHTQQLTLLQQQLRGRPLVAVGLEEQFKSLSPFGQYVAEGGAPWLLLVGWNTLDPSQPRLRQQLTGTRSQPEALRRLAQRPEALLYLPPSGEAKAFGRYYLQHWVGVSWPSGRVVSLSPIHP